MAKRKRAGEAEETPSSAERRARRKASARSDDASELAPVSRTKTGEPERFEAGSKDGKPGTWRPGVSGNPNGRPKSKLATAYAELMDSDDAVELLAKAKEAAAGGSERLLIFLLGPAVRAFDPKGASGYVPKLCATMDEIAEEQARLLLAYAQGLVDVEMFEKLNKAFDSLAATVDRRDDREWGAQVAAMVRWHRGEATEEDMRLILGRFQGKEQPKDGDEHAA